MSRTSRSSSFWCAALLAAATIAAYCGSLAGPFVFDDDPTIRDNPSIRQLWPLWRALFPPPGRGLTSNGRPLVNLSLALNYAGGGNTVFSYHLLNLAIHVLVALVLFGLARRTLELTDFAPRALPLAFVIALTWALHPLATESVTYIVQRAESLMALFYLLTLYCFVRGVRPSSAPHGGGATAGQRAGEPRRWLWLGLSAFACLFGMAAKEVMVSAPLLVLLYDRTFVSGSFAEAWRRHRTLYFALAATWLALVWEVAVTGNRGDTAGFGTATPWTTYAWAQPTAIVHYLRLVFWPHPLVFDYGADLHTGIVPTLARGVIVAALVAATIYALARRPAAGFLGVAFFAILAPSSSVVPVATQVMAEHRMYLPLAAVIALAVCAVAGSRRALLPAALILAAALGALTARRNRDYATTRRLWASAAAAYPTNPRSHSNLGFIINAQGDPRGAMVEFQKALALDPDYGDAQNNLGGAYFQLGDIPESIVHYRAAIRINPAMASAHYNLGNSLVRTGRTEEGLAEFRQSLALDASSADAHYNYATTLSYLHDLPDAIHEYEEALRIRPDYAEARNNLATALLQSGRIDAALAQYRESLALDPRAATAHFNLANILVQKGDMKEALAHYHRALEIDPGYAKAHCNLGSALVRLGRLNEAAAEYREALRINPNLAEASHNLERLQAYLESSHP